MFVQSRGMFAGNMSEGFGLPVESIMKCEDFKSNFARKLSNRYISRPAPRQDTTLKPQPRSLEEVSKNAPERIETYSQLSKSSVEEHKSESTRLLDKTTSKNSEMRRIEVSALNMEVETLKWQLAQTEANRQMHIALIKQIVTFLNRVKEHIDSQNNEPVLRRDTLSTKMSHKTYNCDLPRSRSVLHVNSNLEYSPNIPKKLSARKIIKSISNVNGYKDCNGFWSQSKLSLISESETAHKMSEEITRLTTLANTVLCTKLPDLACKCKDNLNESNIEINKPTDDIHKVETQSQNQFTVHLNRIEEDPVPALSLTLQDNFKAFGGINDNFAEIKDVTMNDYEYIVDPFECDLKTEFANMKLEDNGTTETKMTQLNGNTAFKEGRNEYSHTSNFIEDESGFSSMSSFQDIGIPIISIIPPSPSKEVGFVEDMPDFMDERKKWKTDTLELDKQAMKVFWV